MVGGGATGVELAGTMGELRGTVLRSAFPDVDPSRIHVHLVEMASQLLMPFHPKLREYARRQLVKRGVDIRLNTKILEVRPDRVVIGDGESLPSDLTVWAAGVAGPDALAGLGLPRGHAGRVLVLPDLRVEGSDRIFAIGDIALCEQDPAPQLAQPALQQGKHAAEQVVRLVRGEPTQPFSYRDRGMMATIGRRSAVVELPIGVRFTGTLAWLAVARPAPDLPARRQEPGHHADQPVLALPRLGARRERDRRRRAARAAAGAAAGRGRRAGAGGVGAEGNREGDGEPGMIHYDPV